MTMLLPWALLAGCATSTVTEDAQPVSSIGQRLLAPESHGGQAGEIQPYRLSGSEVFRMPGALFTPLPVLPASVSRQSLPRVTVCLNVILDEQGQVQRSFPLLAHSHCGDGNHEDSGYLLQAAADAVQQWRFLPAAICHFAPGIEPATPDDCAAATRVEAVPVTLPYAFTFEVVRGQARVHIQPASR